MKYSSRDSISIVSGEPVSSDGCIPFFMGTSGKEDVVSRLTDGDSTKKLVLEVLLEHGWEAVFAHAICTKLYLTAVGYKEAIAYLSAGDGFNRTLSGTYTSEGRDILGNQSVLIPLGASDDEIVSLAVTFVTNVSNAVAQSYAGRLFEPGKTI